MVTNSVVPIDQLGLSHPSETILTQHLTSGFWQGVKRVGRVFKNTKKFEIEGVPP